MTHTVDTEAVGEFLAQRRIAVVGASDDPKKFGGTVYRQFKRHGYEAIPVNPTRSLVDGDTCYPDVVSIPGAVDGAVIVVDAEKSADVVRDCADKDIPRVWFFKGLGGPGASSPPALHVAYQHDMAVVDGACPLMFLEPVGWFHKVHRAVRRMDGSLTRIGA